jgi:hypothetical protein
MCIFLTVRTLAKVLVVVIGVSFFAGLYVGISGVGRSGARGPATDSSVATAVVTDLEWLG